MSQAAASLPKYLNQFIATQDYTSYTARDHAVWRYIMRRGRQLFKDNAVSVWEQGLKKTGIPFDRIPNIAEMDAALDRFGWGAVPVTGFIPPAAFIDFQARGVLPIAADMRTVEHVGYTPAPDIVHEAAGHAPILIDPAYATFLRSYGIVARKAISSKKDFQLFEAIRKLSDIKEDPQTTAEEIKQANEELERAAAAIDHVSEAGHLARLAWWTVEYGLVGSLSNPKIYGAGLLSSVAESEACLKPHVKKIPLSLDCIHQSYDITEPQPQLFVVESLDRLPELVREFERTMAYKTGGASGLAKAQQAESVCTWELDSGVQVSGVVARYETDDAGQIIFVKNAGPTQLCVAEKQLAGQGKERHGEGFSSPIGRWKATVDRSPASLSVAELQRLGISRGATATVEYVNGYTVRGNVTNIHHHAGKLLYITFEDCTVSRGTQVAFQPSWGPFDLVVGESVTSVWNGPADPDAYGTFDFGRATTKPGRRDPYSSAEKELFKEYEKVRALRKTQGSLHEIQTLAQTFLKNYSKEWLLGLELMELLTQQYQQQHEGLNAWAVKAQEALHRSTLRDDRAAAELLKAGLEVVAKPDPESW